MQKIDESVRRATRLLRSTRTNRKQLPNVEALPEVS